MDWIKSLVIVFGAMLIISCEPDRIESGFRPLYFHFDDLSVIKRGDPIEIGLAGKIVTTGSYVFVNERYRGIHVIDNTDPENPILKHFWNIPGNLEFTILQSILYADNGRDLIVIDISSYDNIQVLEVFKNQYVPDLADIYPKEYFGYFECYDASLGGFAGWEKVTLINPECRTF